MKTAIRTLTTIVAIAAFFITSTTVSTTAGEISSPGAIVVNVVDKDGEPLTGAQVTLKLPGEDGKIYSGSDTNVSKTDGDSDDDTAAMSVKTDDGDVEFKKESLYGMIADGQVFEAIAQLDDFVDARQTSEYSAASINDVEIKMTAVGDTLAETKKEKAVAQKAAAGDIVVSLKKMRNDSERTMLGFTAELTLPGEDGTMAAPNNTFLLTDGDKHDPDISLNGSIIFPVKYIGKFISDKNTCKVRIVSETGQKAEDIEKSLKYSSDSINKVDFTLAPPPPPEPAGETVDEEADEGEAAGDDNNANNERN